MAIIKCPECGKEISDTCSNCIHCGFSLQTTPSPVVTSEKTKKQINFSEIISKYKIALIIVLAIVLLIIVVVSLASANANRDPFEKLYNDQTRESVQTALGTPDSSKDKDTNEEYSWNIDEYYNVTFLGKTGNLEIWYDDDNFVSHAWFTYDYPTNPNNPVAEPSSKERDEAREYELEIIAFYTEKYGAPENGYYDYEWYLDDGSKIGLTFDLDPDVLDSVIEIKWD